MINNHYYVSFPKAHQNSSHNKEQHFLFCVSYRNPTYDKEQHSLVCVMS